MDQSEPKFREGEKVILVQEFTFGGETYQANPSISAVPVGSIGRVTDPEWGETNGYRTVGVYWESEILPEYRSEPEFGVDEYCLALANPLPDFSNLQEVDAWLRS